MTRRVVIASRETLGRIQRAVRGYENMGRGGTAQSSENGPGEESDSVLCKTTAAWAKGTSALLQIWAGRPGSETYTGVKITAYNRVGAFKSDDFVTVQLNRHGYYYAVGAGGGLVRLSKTTSVWEKSTTTSLVVYDGTPGAESATGETLEAYNHYGKVLSGKWVMIGQTPQGNNYLIAPESDQQDVVYNAAIVATTVSGVTTSKLVFYRKKVWVHSVEESTTVEIGLAECVPGYSG